MVEISENMDPEDRAITDSALIRKMLWGYFPEQRDAVLALEKDEQEYAPPGDSAPVQVGAYTLASEIFVQGVLAPLLASAPELDEELAQRCADFLECLLGSGRASIHEMVSIRITDHLLGYPENWEKFRVYAGNLLLGEVRERQRYYEIPIDRGDQTEDGGAVDHLQVSDAVLDADAS
ncbi:hypothetical protein J2X68_008005 [Streptomyces sp. 3330]|uniref:hypothetical protein n=1 Tax=Streptomyces sp. 3330 TaxID=2817755 RepID=UPI0028586E43|nr:hypothetical protein [Streptomyces sp. 3330]MDR6981262.1 hypothetical protein [Streptomyces sp. 3330]